MENKTYKLILAGFGDVGKTSFVISHLTNEFRSKYIPTLGVEVHPIKVDGTTFNVWDCAGQERYGGLRDGYYIQANCAIVMFNAINPGNFEDWIRDIKRVCGDIPIVIVANKIDLLSSNIGLEDYICISVKEGKNMLKPFEELIKLLN